MMLPPRNEPETIRPAAERTSEEASRVDAVALRGVRRGWPRGPRPVLDGVDLSVDAGTVVWLGGENGVGKTTLLRVITGVLEPERGSVSVFELDATRHRRRYQRQIAFLSAGNSGLYARLTVAQHLDLWARIAFVPRQERADRVAATIDAFRLAPLARSRVDRISMGQRQRLRLAMTFLPAPRVALLDEPRNSLDREGLEMLVVALRDLTARGGAAIWCSPAGEDLGMEVDKRYLLDDGKLAVQ